VAKQVYYEDVEVGMELPTLVKTPTPQQLVKWAGASGDFYQIHYDKDFAIKNGLPGIIVHGLLTCAFLGQMLTDWIGEEGTLKKYGVSYRGMHLPYQEIYCKGKVTNKYIQNGDHIVECEIWSENPKGEKCVPGTATVILPSRG
jgi:acyl dehydratase